MPEKNNFNNKPIIIDKWQRDDTYEGVYPSGARVKDAYFSPQTPEHTCIKSNWRYLFKLPRNHFPWQFWCEIIAYRFGCVIGVDVPPAHIGLSGTYKSGVDTYAALIEWFYDYKTQGYISGGQLMVALIKNFDRDKGKKHNLKTILDAFFEAPDIPKTVVEHWARVLIFDVLIGNTDRHQDNWGLIVQRPERPTAKSSLLFAPAFDNGTALGYNILEENLDKYTDAGKLTRYLTNKKAKHHMKWSLDTDEPLNFYQFLKKFAMDFPEITPIMQGLLSFTLQQVDEALSPLLKAVGNPEYKLTEKRLDFILKLIFERKRMLEEILKL